ncbi:MAG: XRE family transcriptional regulator [Burkholderiales bacterium PBB6]|nr:MAG: XRE family transcriptional regulator [Burkholderiales bacterium PBB6]
MTDSQEPGAPAPASSPAPAGTATTAGSLLRAARQAQGWHVAALATQLKVAPRKLEALEADQYDDLQGTAFVRALALAACRALKIDAEPVLAALPSMEQRTLDRVNGGLNAPFREHNGHVDRLDWLKASKGAVALVAILLVGAALMWFAPPGFGVAAWLSKPAAASAAASSADADNEPVLVPAPTAPVPASAVPAVSGTAASVPASAPAGAATSAVSVLPPASVPSVQSASTTPSTTPASLQAVAAAADVGTVALSATSASWVEVQDAAGRVMLGRTLAAGEAVQLDGALPLRVKIGNASATQLRWRGQAVDLATWTRDNVARVELK